MLYELATDELPFGLPTTDSGLCHPAVEGSQAAARPAPRLARIAARGYLIRDMPQPRMRSSECGLVVQAA